MVKIIVFRKYTEPRFIKGRRFQTLHRFRNERLLLMHQRINCRAKRIEISTVLILKVHVFCAHHAVPAVRCRVTGDLSLRLDRPGYAIPAQTCLRRQIPHDIGVVPCIESLHLCLFSVHFKTALHVSPGIIVGNRPV